MVTRSFTRTLLALSVGLLTASSASADRRTGLSGSLLIEDQDDLYIFPQTLTTYRNLISLDYGPDASGGQGNGVFTLGDPDMAFGVAIHRGDVLAPHAIDEILALDGPASLFARTGTFAVEPATIVDFLFATGGFGLRAAIGRGFESPTATGTSESDTFLMGEVGFGSGTRGQDTRIDFSGALTLDFAGQETGMMDSSSGTHIAVSGLLRGFSPMETNMDLGWLVNAQVASNSVTDQTMMGDPADSIFGVDVGGGLGPAFRFGRAQIAAYGILRIGFDASDPNSEVDDNEVSTLSFVIPGVHMAAEIALNDWLRVRTGAEYGWNLVDVNPSAPGAAGGGLQSGSFGWNAGLGVVVDQFRFDGALERSMVTAGPDFIGGAGSGLFMIASMTYNFDADRTGTAAPEAEPAAEPAPEPPVPTSEFAPAPAPEAPAPDPTVNPEVGVDTGAATPTPSPTPAVAPAPAPAP